MNIVYMGTPAIAAVILKDLHEAGHRIIGAVTQQDKPKGRGNQVQYSAVKEMALSLNIPVFQPRRVKEPEFIEILKQLNPDVIVVAAFGQILSKVILELPKFGCINVHASLLPKYRGSAPIQWSIIEGEEKTGITIMHMDEGIDTGDMISKKEITLSPKETFGTLHDKLAEAAGPLLIHALADIEAGRATRTRQGDSNSMYARILDKSLGHIDFSQPAIKIERLIRGLNPWPSAFTFLEGKMLKIWDADVEPAQENGAPGEIIAVRKDAVLVQTGEGILAVKELQLEGKKRMTSESFLRGYEVKANTVLQ
ncbi:methionyl-tRNA formyltransferase [Anaerocolumna sp. AGMB13020]|uniref:methionyl-tRNA formyltransferase n=1 Tax=Anaerocolumna sp. AGMB13020 TaxID=3081750 RepID=UPI002952DD05|nr:methionyl-tRNA formyltransferase [Anaerocolumna sp. AGMB13020]WOO36495.1 methionyl-tRNA formyltransferase [Anaerocolumna sp. AGMB13020]